jgi:hypothetical protein
VAAGQALQCAQARHPLYCFSAALPCSAFWSAAPKAVSSALRGACFSSLHLRNSLAALFSFAFFNDSEMRLRA